MTKQCSKCKKILDTSMFWKNSTNISGFQAYCISCHNKQKAKWIKKNPDKYQKMNTKKRNPKAALNSKLRSRKMRKDLSDRYLRDIMTMGHSLKPKDIPIEMVEMHRINLKIKRVLKLTPKLKGEGD